MNDNPPFWRNFRFNGSERNEIFEGRNRQKSIKDGLVVFMTPEMHRTGKNSFHMNPQNKIWQDLKKQAEKRWCEYYKKTTDDFREKYGKNYL